MNGTATLTRHPMQPVPPDPGSVRLLAVVPLMAEITTAADGAHLLRAIADRRDRRAFAALFRFYAPRVKTYLTRQGAPEGEAEELTQETFLAVWNKAASFDPAKAAASTWIFTIARNRRIDALRRERHFEADPADPLLVPEAPPSGETVLDGREKQERVARALAALPDDQAEVVRLSFFEEKSHGEIAGTLGLPLGTVKSRLRLAFKRVRAALADAYGPDGDAS